MSALGSTDAAGAGAPPPGSKVASSPKLSIAVHCDAEMQCSAEYAAWASIRVLTAPAPAGAKIWTWPVASPLTQSEGHAIPARPLAASIAVSPPAWPGAKLTTFPALSIATHWPVLGQVAAAIALPASTTL